ncbi:hypothetical protein [Bartonella apis]|uniref:hypothetical protein n=1 Tax=Bartonella apis TaxID=1686310 RepID=UPI003BB76DBD
MLKQSALWRLAVTKQWRLTHLIVSNAFDETLCHTTIEPVDFAERVQPVHIKIRPMGNIAACKKGSEKAADLLFDQHW